MRIVPVSAEELTRSAIEYHGLLRDAVDHGASVGFTVPLAEAQVAEYWRGVGAELKTGHRILLAARDDAQRLLGAGQIALETRSNGRHRAEIQKVLVFAARRGAGVGTLLMRALEKAAQAHGRSLIYLDTSVGPGGATRLYEKLGYTAGGGIPDWAMDPDGTLRANVIYYKKLG
jgi:ribosomal protein S18 acetylase RimI-like enzyme